MKLNECIERIERYLNSNDYTPRFVNMQNTKDRTKFLERFSVGDNIILPFTTDGKKDEDPQVADLWRKLYEISGNVFVTGLSTYLKLMGKEILLRELRSFTTQTFKGHVVILCYQCEEYLSFHDKRANRLVYSIDRDNVEPSIIPKIIFTFQQLPVKANITVVDGVENIAETVETMEGKEIYVKSNKHKDSYPNSILYLDEIRTAFDALCSIDATAKSLSDSYGTEKQWTYLLLKVSKRGSLGALLGQQFNVINKLGLIASNWKTFSEDEKWLYFIGLKLYGAGEGYWCLNEATKNADNMAVLLRCIYRSLLNIEPKSQDFWRKYDERKLLIESFGQSGQEVTDYLQILKSKEENALYYLTDSSRQEKEFVFELLARYEDKFTREDVFAVLSHIYPDLYDYLQPYRFKNETLNKYFQDYKYQKVVNKIYPEFREVVEKQAIDRDFNRWLSPRTEKLEALDKNKARLYFVDALGVEYLGFIMTQCKKLNLMANVCICRCELPSITSLNKEFLDMFTDVAPAIKKLDNIKHHGEESFDYTKTKLPLHLVQELEIVKEILSKIRDQLASGSIERAYIIADHGASRLAVINEKESQWEMASKGEHSGRCCPKNEVNAKAEYVTEANNFWILANYDRFKGGRKASVEVHGGATLEEVAVPIIEFTYVAGEIEISIRSKLPIEVSFRKKAELQLFSKTRLSDVTVCVNGKKLINKYYEAEMQDNNMYLVRMPDIKDAGKYSLGVFSSNNKIADLQFTVKKEGSSIKDIL